MVVKSVRHRQYAQDSFYFKGKKYTKIAYSYSRKEAFKRKAELKKDALRKKKYHYKYKIRFTQEWTKARGLRTAYGIFANYKK